MTEPEPLPETRGAPSARIWPLFVILAGCALGVWGFARRSGDYAGISIALTAIATLLAILGWLFAFSRLEGRRRLNVLAALLTVAICAAALVRIRGYTGDTVPILTLRWWQGSTELVSTDERVELERSPHDVVEFLGPGRRPEYAPVALARDWTKSRPTIRWRKRLGEGFSSFAVVGEHAFTQTQLDNEECVVCLHWPSGEVRWIHRTEVRFQSSLGGNGPRATPTFHDGRLYTLGATGVLSCIDAADGSGIWSVDLVERCGGRVPQWGYAGSPLVVDDLVVVSAGGPNGWSAVAFQRSSGEVRWHAGDEAAAYASPMLATLAGRRVILIAERPSLTAYDPKDGRILWSTPLGSGENVSQPVVLGADLVLYTKGYGTGAHLWRLTPSHGGTLSGETVWRSRRVLKTKFTQPILFEGHLYDVSDGMAMECVDPMTGEQLWRQRGGFGHGQTLRTGDLILSMSEQGELYLVEASPEGYRELGRFRIFAARTWNPPVLIGHTLLVRNDVEAVCVDLPTLSE